jgi:hypothetical protein
MPNYIQYSTSIPSGSLKKGNAALGIADSVAGPTSTNGWYTGINPPTGSYTVYEVAASGDPDIYCPINTTELINLVKSKGATGSNTGSVAAALAWIATQNNLLATNEVYPNIVTSGSVMMVDAGFVGSYPTTASTWYDISGNNEDFSLNNGPTFNPNGAIGFDGTDDFAFNSDLKYSPFSFDITFKGSNSNGYIARLSGFGWGMFIPSANIVNVWVDTDTSHRTTTTGISYSGNLITNISVVFTSSAFSLYKNGVFLQTVSTPSSSLYSTTTSFRLATDNGATGFFSGSIYSAKMYNRALTQAEITQNYYQAPIVTNGLVLAVDAGNVVSYESGSSLTYSLTGSNSGSLINGTGYSNINNGTWVFDGTDDYINFGDVTSTEFGTGDFTLSCWIFIPTNVVENINFFKGLIIKKGASAADAGYGIYYNTGQKKFLWSTANGTSSVERFSTNTWDSLKGRWSNIVMVRQNGATNNGFFYINGVYESIASSATVVNVNNDYNLTIGASSTLFSNYFFQGNIAAGLIYNRALSETEITQNYNAQKSRFGF